MPPRSSAPARRRRRCRRSSDVTRETRRKVQRSTRATTNASVAAAVVCGGREPAEPVRAPSKRHRRPWVFSVSSPEPALGGRPLQRRRAAPGGAAPRLGTWLDGLARAQPSVSRKHAGSQARARTQPCAMRSGQRCVAVAVRGLRARAVRDRSQRADARSTPRRRDDPRERSCCLWRLLRRAWQPLHSPVHPPTT